MAIIEGGLSGNIVEAGAYSGANALHVQGRPTSFGSLGHYQFGINCGTSGAPMVAGTAPDSEIVQFRWTHSTNLAVIQEIWVQSFVSFGTGFAAGIGQFDLTLARSWTAAGTGGTAATLTGNNNKLRTSMGSTAVGEIRYSATDVLGAGTKTLDANRVNYRMCGVSTATYTAFIGTTPGPLFLADVASGHHPIILAQNEGFVIRATVPATGTWEATFMLKWAEVTAY